MLKYLEEAVHCKCRRRKIYYLSRYYYQMSFKL